MKKIYSSVGVLIVLLTPVLALAQFGQVNTFFADVSNFINSVLIPLVFAVALLVFIWGVFQYFILGGGDSEKQDAGKKLMLYAIIGFVVMVSIFGIVNLIAGGLGFSADEDLQNIPNVPVTNT